MEWKSSIEELDEVTRQLKVVIPGQNFTDQYNSALNRYMAEVKVKGFRPGKAPRQIVQKMYGSKIHSEVVSRLVSTSLADVLKENNIEAIGMPEITLGESVSEELNYTANVSILPTPEITGYEKFEIVVEKKEVVSADVDQVVENLRKSKATVKPLVDRTVAQIGDVVEVEFLVIEGDKKPAERGEPATIALGDGRISEELEARIAGMNIGEVKVISQAELEENQEEKSDSKNSYRVTLKSVSERILPEVDDAFAASLGYGVETLLELRTRISEDLENSRQQQAKQEAQVKVLEQLIAKNDFKVPQVMVDDEIRSILVQERLVDPQKHDLARISMAPFRQHFEQPARKRVVTRITVDRVALQEKIEVLEEDLERSFQELAAAYNVPVESARNYFKEKGHTADFEEELKRSKVLEFLLSRADIKYVNELPASEVK